MALRAVKVDESWRELGYRRIQRGAAEVDTALDRLKPLRSLIRDTEESQSMCAAAPPGSGSTKRCV